MTDKLFTLRVPVADRFDKRLITITAYDNGFDERGAQKYVATVQFGRKYVFPFFENGGW